jgi:hypothetical protein
VSDLKRTTKRHGLLSAIAAGRVEVYIGIGDSLVRDGEFLAGPEKRTELDVLPYIQRNRLGRMGTKYRARLTDSGRALLAAWDEKHGKEEA